MLPWLNSLIPALTSWMVLPGMAILGAALVSSPIIIHLLNKRKFKIVDWAAMDFLLDADKRNRRRVRLENLLLLLLRCLAVFLLGLLLAQPFISRLPQSSMAGLLGATQFEHIVVLDDSLSTQVQTGTQTAFDEAQQRLIEMLKSLAEDRNDNMFTLILTSAPDERLINGVRVKPDSVAELTAAIDDLKPSDLAADLPKLLLALEQELADQPKNINRTLYIVTDLRQRDWEREDGAGEDNDPAKVVARIADDITAVYLLDIGGELNKNLVVTEIRPEGVLVAGVESRFDVTVTNYSSTEARDVTVRLKAGEALPLEKSLEVIPANSSETIPFSFTFATSDARTPSGEPAPLEAVRVTVEIESQRPGEEDRLVADSKAIYPARIVHGIPTLIVDGDPSSNPQRSESYFLTHALDPTGPFLSGVSVDVVHEQEMETTSLAKYQVIFLCNVYHLGEKVMQDLELWVKNGGGLVIMPGDHVDEVTFNKEFFVDGKGLAPLRLNSIEGDETRETWSQFRIVDKAHPLLAVFGDQDDPALELTKVFSWWSTDVAEGETGKAVKIPARFNDANDSIAIAERSIGRGRVLMTSIPADVDWHIWPIFPNYVVAMHELVRHMAGDVVGSGAFRVGEPLVQMVDLSDFRTEAELRLPRERKASLQARDPSQAASSTNAGGEKKDGDANPSDPPVPSAGQTQWQFIYDAAVASGFYELRLTRTDGVEEQRLFAANVDPGEGNLARIDQAALKQAFGDSPVTILKAASIGSITGSGKQWELWKIILVLAVVVLAGEQLFAWAFGLRR